MSSRRKILAKLRELNPRSDAFYGIAAGYLREHSRAHRNYGRFWIGLGLVSWLGVFDVPSRGLACWQLFDFLFSSCVGWVLICSSHRAAHALARADVDSDADRRLRRLTQVALIYGGDPVARLIAEFIKNDYASARPSDEGSQERGR